MYILCDKLDQDDQRVKVIELDKLEDSSEGNSAINCGDWIHTIKPAISNLSKRPTQYWKTIERVVEKRYQKYLVSSPECKDEVEKKEEYSKLKAIIIERC